MRRQFSHGLPLSGTSITPNFVGHMRNGAGKARSEGAVRSCLCVSRKISPTLVCVLLTTIVLTGGAIADESWLGVPSDDWNDPNNWQVAVPTASDDVTVGVPVHHNVLIGAGVNAVADTLSVGFLKGTFPTWDSPSGLSGLLNISGGGTLVTNSASLGLLSNYLGTMVVTGAGSNWDSTILVIGNDGDGALDVNTSATVNGNTTILGNSAGAAGTLTLSTGAGFMASSGMIIGNYGDGTVTMDSASTLSAGYLYLAAGSGSTGSATVSGTGTTLGVTSTLNVGMLGTATMTVDTDADVTAGTLTVNGANSALNVDGSGSTVTVTSSTTVGHSGSGTLNISNGGSVSSSMYVVGNLAGSTGTIALTSGGQLNGSGDLNLGLGAGAAGYASVDGATTAIVNTGDLNIGGAGLGFLDITNSGTVSTPGGNVYLATAGAGAGTLTVDGAGSTLNTSALYAGYAGTGDVAVSIQGRINANVLNLGGLLNGSGQLTVDGSGSTVQVTSNALVGDLGWGVLTVSNSASFSADQLTIGNSSGRTGTVNINSGGTATVTTSLSVGEAGTGTLNVNGGSATVTNDMVVANTSAGLGTVNVSSGLVSVGGVLSVGALGDGTFNLDGSGSTVAVTDDVRVGAMGTGVLDITNGGYLLSGTGDMYLGGSFGAGTGGQGTVHVDGAGSLLEVANGAVLSGYSGSGTLLITNGGGVQSATGYLGFGGTGAGAGLVTGTGSNWTMTNSLYVGYQGDGALVIANGGLVSTSGPVDWLGAATGATGTALIMGAGSTWQTTGGLYIGGTGSGDVTVMQGGALNTGTGISLGLDAGSTGILNIGAAEGQPAQAAGSVTAGNIVFGLGTSTLVFNHTDTAYTLSSILETLGTTGDIRQLSGHTILTGMSTLFDGTTTVTGGTLSVNGALDGTINVTGGTLGGNGVLLGTSNIGSGGTLAPGNSVGTLFAGDVTFASGSTYTVELNDAGSLAGTNNDVLLSSGTVTINGGTVHVTPENGTDDGTTYTPGTTYTIIAANTGVTGAFNAASDDYAFLNFALSYDLNNVYLASSLPISSFCLSGMSANECAAGDGVFSLASGSLFTAVLNLSNAEASGALDLLSGEIHASARTALIEDSRFVREAAIARTRAVFDGVASDRVAEHKLSERLAFWGQGFGAWGDWDSDGNAASLDRSIGGVFLGGDACVSDNVRIGALGGYSGSNFNVGARASSANVESAYAALYGGGQWGALGLRVGGAYGWHGIDTARAVAFTGFSDYLAASYDAATMQAFGEAAWRIDAGANTRVEPFANVAYVNLDADAFTETGGAAALSGSSDQTNAPFLTLGLRADTAFLLGQAKARLTGSLGWQHVFGDDVPLSLMTFIAGGGPFGIAGVPLAENVLVVDAGLGMTLAPDATLGLTYGGQLGSGLIDQSVKGGVNVKF
jgi:outer membrane autotransporter protein